MARSAANRKNKADVLLSIRISDDSDSIWTVDKWSEFVESLIRASFDLAADVSVSVDGGIEVPRKQPDSPE